MDDRHQVALAGFFVANGFTSLAISKAKGYKITAQVGSSTLNAGHLPVLKQLQQAFGGRVHVIDKQSGRMAGRTEYRWLLSGASRLEAFLSVVASLDLDSYKVYKTRVLLEFIRWRRTRPHSGLSAADKETVQRFANRHQRGEKTNAQDQ